MYRHIHFTQSLETNLGGGLATSLLSLHSSMLEQGLDSLIVSTCRSQSFLDSHKLPNHTYCFVESFPSPLFFSTQACLFKSKITAKPAIYHSHGLHTYLQYLFRSSSLPPCSKLVIHPHGFFDPYIANRSKFKKSIINFLYEKNNFNHASAWRALTHVESEQIKKRNYDHSPSNIFTLPNGVSSPVPLVSSDLVDIPSYLISLFNSYRNKLVFMSRIHPKKGLDNLIRAWSIIEPKFPNWDLIVAGPSFNASYDSFLEELVIKYDLRNVHFIGPVYGVLKRFVLTKADAFVLPSFSEGFPMVVLEAASYGLPIVVTRESNISDLCKNHMAISCDSNHTSIAANLISLFSESNSSISLRSANLKSYVAHQYSWNSIASRLNTYCHSLF